MEPLRYWIRPICISDIDSQRIYRYIISVDTTSCASKGEKRNAPLVPFEFREDLLLSVGNIDSNFSMEFTDCLWANSLENTLELETIQG
jgi:hypothetical protein